MTDVITDFTRRRDAIDTSGLHDAIFSVDLRAARQVGTMPVPLANVLERLILGKPVQRADLDRSGVRIMAVYDMAELTEPPAEGATHWPRRQLNDDAPPSI